MMCLKFALKEGLEEVSGVCAEGAGLATANSYWGYVTGTWEAIHYFVYFCVCWKLSMLKDLSKVSKHSNILRYDKVKPSITKYLVYYSLHFYVLKILYLKNTT